MRARIGLLLLYPLILLALAYIALRYVSAAVAAPGKAANIALLIDQAANLGLNGQMYSTISARAGRARAHGRAWGCVLCRVLDWIAPQHCEREMRKEATAATGG